MILQQVNYGHMMFTPKGTAYPTAFQAPVRSVVIDPRKQPSIKINPKHDRKGKIVEGQLRFQ